LVDGDDVGLDKIKVTISHLLEVKFIPEGGEGERGPNESRVVADLYNVSKPSDFWLSPANVLYLDALEGNATLLGLPCKTQMMPPPRHA